MIPTIYIKGTKAEIKKLKEGTLPSQITGMVYDLYNESRKSLAELPNGTVIKFWKKKDFNGTPIAASYGNWRPAKNKID